MVQFYLFGFVKPHSISEVHVDSRRAPVLSLLDACFFVDFLSSQYFLDERLAVRSWSTNSLPLI